jgi:hypothetical protein
LNCCKKNDMEKPFFCCARLIDLSVLEHFVSVHNMKTLKIKQNHMYMWP